MTVLRPKFAVWAERPTSQPYPAQLSPPFLLLLFIPLCSRLISWRSLLPNPALLSETVPCAVLLPCRSSGRAAAALGAGPQHRPRPEDPRPPSHSYLTLSTMSESSICGALFANLCVSGIGQWCNVCECPPCLASRQFGLTRLPSLDPSQARQAATMQATNSPDASRADAEGTTTRMRLIGPIGRSGRGRGWPRSRRLERGRTSSNQGSSLHDSLSSRVACVKDQVANDNYVSSALLLQGCRADARRRQPRVPRLGRSRQGGRDEALSSPFFSSIFL